MWELEASGPPMTYPRKKDERELTFHQQGFYLLDWAAASSRRSLGQL